MARPSEFTRQVADAICERIAEGESLRSICSGDEMPNKATVFRWLAADKAFSDQYARAREEQAETLADELIDIADEPPEKGPAGTVDAGHVQDKRLRIETRKWAASKLKPKKYGDKVTQEHTGPNGGPIQSETVTMTAEEAYKRMLDGGA